MMCARLSIMQRSKIRLLHLILWISKVHEELNVLLSFSLHVKVQQAQREQMAVMSFLADLPPEFETVKSQILSSSEIFSLHDTFTRVLRTENS